MPKYVLNLNEFIKQCVEKAKDEYPEGRSFESSIDLDVNELTNEVRVIVDVYPRTTGQVH